MHCLLRKLLVTHLMIVSPIFSKVPQVIQASERSKPEQAAKAPNIAGMPER